MKADQIMAMQRKLRVKVDGVWGPVSIAACRAHLEGLMKPYPYPGTSERELLEFYGPAGDQRRLDWLHVEDLGIIFEGEQVRIVRVHERLADSLYSILVELKERFPHVVRQYAGVYMNRPMRGGTRPSLHARGAAIDLMPATNGNLAPWPLKADMPLEVMEIFARRGWLAAGAFWGRDAMHFQATRPR